MTISGLDHNCNTCASSLRPAGILLHSINRRQMYKCTEASTKTSIVSKLASEVSPACSKNCLLGCLDVLEVLGSSSRKLNLWLFRHIRNRCYDHWGSVESSSTRRFFFKPECEKRSLRKKVVSKLMKLRISH